MNFVIIPYERTSKMPRRHDVLESWLSHRQITHQQAEAGRRFRDLYDVADMGGHAVIDPGPKSTTVRSGVGLDRATAKSEMLALRPVLGSFDFALVCRVVGAGGDLVGATVTDGKRVTTDTHAPNDAERRYLAHRVRDALSIMANQFRIESRRP